MRLAICAALSLLTISAHAEDKSKECGKTVEECQKQVDAAAISIAMLQRQLQAYRNLLTEANDRLVAQVGK